MNRYPTTIAADLRCHAETIIHAETIEEARAIAAAQAVEDELEWAFVEVMGEIAVLARQVGEIDVETWWDAPAKPGEPSYGELEAFARRIAALPTADEEWKAAIAAGDVEEGDYEDAGDYIADRDDEALFADRAELQQLVAQARKLFGR